MNKVKGALVLKSGVSLKGEFWFDRWDDNIWFESKGVVYPPVYLKYRAKPLELNMILRLTYAGQKIIDLVPHRNPFLQLIHKSESEGILYNLPIIYGLE